MNYEDERFKALDAEKNKTLTDTTNVYNDLLSKNQNILDQNNSWQDTYQQTQNDLLDKGTALATNKLEQGKKDAENAYQKEAIASEAGYQEYINPYGVDAEKKAESNLTNTGYSESTKSSAYNVSRIRTAVAKASKEKAVIEYDQAIAEAQLNNNSQKATLALDLLKQKLANIASSFQTETTLKQNQMSDKTNIDNTYYNRYQDVIEQKNYEEQQAEARRQYEEQLAYQKQQQIVAQQQWEQELAYKKQQDAISNAQNWATINAKKKTEDGVDLTGNTTKTYTSKDLTSKAAKSVYLGLGSQKNVTEEMLSSLIQSANSKYGTMTNDDIKALAGIFGFEVTD